jgi:hypothetical protein
MFNLDFLVYIVEIAAMASTGMLGATLVISSIFRKREDLLLLLRKPK